MMVDETYSVALFRYCTEPGEIACFSSLQIHSKELGSGQYIALWRKKISK